MIEIAFARGGIDVVKDFTDYEVDANNSCLFIYKNEQIVGIYNLDQILYIKFKEEF